MTRCHFLNDTLLTPLCQRPVSPNKKCLDTHRSILEKLKLHVQIQIIDIACVVTVPITVVIVVNLFLVALAVVVFTIEDILFFKGRIAEIFVREDAPIRRLLPAAFLFFDDPMDEPPFKIFLFDEARLFLFCSFETKIRRRFRRPMRFRFPLASFTNLSRASNLTPKFALFKESPEANSGDSTFSSKNPPKCPESFLRLPNSIRTRPRYKRPPYP